jgi:ABC-type multidrug transport system fused ATPase/permease subunit
MLKKIYLILSGSERKQAGILIVMSILMAVIDLLGVASIMPFIAVLASPTVLEENTILKKLFFIVDVGSFEEFRLVLAYIVFFLLLFSILSKALLSYFQLRFVMSCELSISRRLVEGYLHHPYTWFLNKNSTEMGARILTDVQTMISNGLIPSINLISQGLVAIALMSLIIFVDPLLALTSGLTLSLLYGIIYKMASKKLSLIGAERQHRNLERWTALSEAFGGIKEVKAIGLEKIYINRFFGPASIYARLQVTANIIAQFPRYLMEVIIFGGMLLILLFLTASKGGFAEAIPVISLYAFVGLRLMPAMQQIYGSFTQIRATVPVFDLLLEDFSKLHSIDAIDGRGVIDLSKNISLKDVSYTYPGAKKPSLQGISLTVDAGTKVGIVGSTGSGKTTLVDIILGLLDADQGFLEIDGVVIGNQNKRAWQRAIGYVPQYIYLADDTVKANIAFGVESNEIDQEAVERASKLADLHEFIENSLPYKYDTTVGERGVRLSGGQRQRIGLARALYHRPKVLLLDEATSALDNITERQVMQSIQNLGNEITIIMIAHRLSTVRKCDKIILLDSGELKSQGSYEQLKDTDRIFQKMTS